MLIIGTAISWCMSSSGVNKILSPQDVHACMRTHPHACTHTRTHARTHAHTQDDTCTPKYVLTSTLHGGNTVVSGTGENVYIRQNTQRPFVFSLHYHGCDAKRAAFLVAVLSPIRVVAKTLQHGSHQIRSLADTRKPIQWNVRYPYTMGSSAVCGSEYTGTLKLSTIRMRCLHEMV